MNKKHVLLFAILVLATLFFVMRGLQNPEGRQATGQATEDGKAAHSPSATFDVNSTGAITPSAFLDEQAGEKRQVAFQQWLQVEAKEMEKSSVDPKIQESRLKGIAQQLAAAEIEYLKKQTLGENVSANESILSVYILTLAPEVSATALGDITTAPLKFSGEQQTHSPEETLAMQEKALRRMALDALFTRAEADLEQREKLKGLIAQIPDPALREYAEKRFKTLR